MENTVDKQSIAVFRTRDGFEARGSVLRMAPFVASLEIYHPELVLQSSEVLTEFRIFVGESTAYAGRAVVQQLVNTGPSAVCEVSLDKDGFDPELFSAVQKVSQVRERFKLFMRQWERTCQIFAQYKLVVADMQSYLGDLRQWLEQIELSVRAAPSGNRARMERDILEELGHQIVPVIDELFEKFESVTSGLEPEGLAAHQAYMKRQLHPLVLCSPFAYRTYAKPLGYAGDYEMVNMMMRDPFEGSSMFAKILNLWFLEQPPARAHRNRVARLETVLVEETARAVRCGRGPRILNVACGPAVELQQFLAESPLSDRVRIDLLDFNEETLAHVRRALEEAKTRHRRMATFGFINRPVHQLLKHASKAVERPPEQQYDLIYCAGLFDYLTDTVCQRLMTLLYSWLAPGGLLVATNVDPSNPLRYGMEHLLDWHLIYRNGARLRALKPSQVPVEDAEIKAELTGVNLFLEVRKPRYA
jgi:extracellular factor (EF) 3-hydroxypalmitic acid methyl ester biosynthesis protein